ncbi:MAG: helix-turn-helix domain-containing protein [Burkholderiaceae bacterium]|nr:helix-turn-helix domain-containing protein [Burkholderiaceae bacterium]
MKKEQAAFGEHLRRALRKAGLSESATELADLVSWAGGDAVTVQAAHNWIRGRTMPRRQNLKALAGALKISPEALYGDAPDAAELTAGASIRANRAPGARDRQTIDAYLALPPKRRRLVGELVAALGDGHANGGGL